MRLDRASARLLIGALILGSAAAGGCQAFRKGPAEPAPVLLPAQPVEQAPPPSPPPPPPPGDSEMAAAAGFLRGGDLVSAAEALDAVIELGAKAPARWEAVYQRALLAATPDDPGRNVPLARDLLGQVLESKPAAERESEARLILALLDLEEGSARAIGDLRSQIETMKAEGEEIRSALAQREDELRRIKEILLEKAPRR